MKKLIKKTSIFVIPFFLIYILAQIFHEKEKGDLLRLGYIFDTNNYDVKVFFKKYFDRTKQYKQVSEISLDTTNTFDFISIGDSFSTQGPVGYQNCMVHNTNIKLLDIDRDLYDSPIQALHDLINGGFFEKNKTKYVILQNVERVFVERGKAIPKTNKFTIDSIKHVLINKSKEKSEKEQEKKPKDQFFSKEIIRFVMYNFNYLYDDNANVSQTYKVNTTKNLFSVSDHKLLFFEDDVKVLKSNNDKLLIENLNNELNALSGILTKMNIQLIVLPSPDKYDIYYDYIVKKEKYEKPIFFDYFNTLKKNYIYINSKDILSKAVKNQKDIYFYDDTHWSPIASELIASEILRICK
jgi:hypothetical protein